MSDYVNITQVVGAIVSGELDDSFDTIREAMKQRKDSKSAILKSTLKIGDHVKFVNGSPKYLIGLEAVVRNKKQKRIGIEFVDKVAAGRFGHGIVNASPSMIEPMPFSNAPDSEHTIKPLTTEEMREGSRQYRTSTDKDMDEVNAFWGVES